MQTRWEVYVGEKARKREGGRVTLHRGAGVQGCGPMGARPGMCVAGRVAPMYDEGWREGWSWGWGERWSEG